MIKRRLLFTSLATIACFAFSAAPAQQPFRFIALGDMPYSDYDASFDRYRTLISIINQRAPRFTVHLGDIKDGYNPCSDVALSAQLDLLNAIDGPVLYTPGDNEWTDCYREKAGAYSPLERLAFIRKTFFVQGARTLGRRRIAVERQADVMSDYRKYVENVRFAIGGVRVISAHVVGSNNNFEVRDRAGRQRVFRSRPSQHRLAWEQHRSGDSRGRQRDRPLDSCRHVRPWLSPPPRSIPTSFGISKLRRSVDRQSAGFCTSDIVGLWRRSQVRYITAVPASGTKHPGG